MTKQYADPFGPPWKLNEFRLMLQWKGSIYQFFWIEWLFATTMCALALGMYYLVFKDTPMDEISQSVKDMWKALHYITGRFQAALSLMLSFYTSTIYGRWWKIRDIEGVVIGRINDLAPQIAGLIRDIPSEVSSHLQNDVDDRSDINISNRMKDQNADEAISAAGVSSGDDQLPNGLDARSQGGDEQSTDELARSNDKETSAESSHERARKKAAEVRLHLVRWLNLAHALAVGELYEKKPNEFSSLENLLEFGLLTEPEYQYMVNTTRSRYVAPFVWFLDLVHELKDKGECGVGESTLLIFTGNVTRIRGSLADLYMYRNVPVPLSYRQLVNVTVRMYMVFNVAEGGMAGFVDESFEEAVSLSVFWNILPFFFEYFMFVGWLSLADALANPFRVWADEFEWENYVRSVCLSSTMFVTKTREASTSAEELGKYTSSILEKSRVARARWETFEDHTDDLSAGFREVTGGMIRHSIGEFGRGLDKVRKGMTGF